MEEEMANRELKRISEAEIINEAYSEGKEIVKNAAEYFEHKSSTTFGQTDSIRIEKSLIHWLHNMDSISKEYGAEVKIIGLSSSKSKVSPLESELLDAYRYNVEQNIELGDNIQKTERNFLLYSQPLFVNSSSCLRCHGTPIEEVEESTLQFLEENYSGSNLYRYSRNKIIGMWSIKLSQKRIVQQL
ncbi:hypothetical protein BH23BAC1_BH23BAC1_45240 [soil metagenome]